MLFTVDVEHRVCDLTVDERLLVFACRLLDDPEQGERFSFTGEQWRAFVPAVRALVERAQQQDDGERVELTERTLPGDVCVEDLWASNRHPSRWRKGTLRLSQEERVLWLDMVQWKAILDTAEDAIAAEVATRARQDEERMRQGLSMFIPRTFAGIV